MPASLVKLDAHSDRRAALREAADVLSGGGLVVFRTDTVYGVGANAASDSAIERLREVKGATSSQSFTVHLPERKSADAYLDKPSSVGRRLIAKGWPGPITLLFRTTDAEKTAIHDRLSPLGRDAVFHDGKVGLRCPDDDVALELLTLAGVPTVASSANRAGHAAPMNADDAATELGDSVDLILDAGRTRYAKGSTIVSVGDDGYQVVREGVYDARTIRRLATLNILFVCTGNTCRSPMAEAIGRQFLARRLNCDVNAIADHGIAVQSCGHMAAGGLPAAPEAVQECRRRGLDISSHRSRSLSGDVARSADYIFTMTANHRRGVVDQFPDVASRVRLLDPSGADISDPLGGTEQDYEIAADLIAAGIEQALGGIEL